jgi:hypothetical protein
MIDFDEFVWSKQNVRLDVVLQEFTEFGQVQIREYLFGSNGHDVQPKNIVPSFTKRKGEVNRVFKYFINSSFEFDSLKVHHADFSNLEYMTDHSVFIAAFPEWFIKNHYKIQSREFWNHVKCTRGDSDHYTVRTEAEFDHYDLNEVEDTELYEQNKCLYETE